MSSNFLETLFEWYVEWAEENEIADPSNLKEELSNFLASCFFAEKIIEMIPEDEWGDRLEEYFRKRALQTIKPNYWYRIDGVACIMNAFKYNGINTVIKKIHEEIKKILQEHPTTETHTWYVAPGTLGPVGTLCEEFGSIPHFTASQFPYVHKFFRDPQTSLWVLASLREEALKDPEIKKWYEDHEIEVKN